MSYILDALKKIEHEKNRKVQPNGRINISGDLFRERAQREIRAGSWKTAVIIVAVSLVTCGGTWFVLKGTGGKNAAIIRQTVSPSPAATPPPVVTPVIPAPAMPVAVPSAPKRVETVENAASVPREVRRLEKQPKPHVLLPKQTVQLVPAPADIKLSGIAWQDERTARRAVINGFLLKEGAVVSGATITEIQATRVRFSSAAGQFEIVLDSVLPAAGVSR